MKDTNPLNNVTPTTNCEAVNKTFHPFETNVDSEEVSIVITSIRQTVIKCSGVGWSLLNCTDVDVAVGYPKCLFRSYWLSKSSNKPQS